jgi:hypothetical protein
VAEVTKESIPILCRTLFLSVDSITRYHRTKFMGMADEMVKQRCNVHTPICISVYSTPGITGLILTYRAVVEQTPTAELSLLI